MTLNVHCYDTNGETILTMQTIEDEIANFFKQNDIKVSMENLNGQFIVYGCPYSDTSEESEVIVFAGTKSCKDTLAELAKQCSHFTIQRGQNV